MNHAKGLIVFVLLTQMAVLGAEKKLHERVPEVPPDAIAPKDTLFHEPLSKILHFTFTDRYQQTLSIADSLIEAYPHRPEPYFFKSAALQGWMSTFRINRFQQEVEANIDSVIENGNTLLEKGKRDPWIHFYLGGAYGYRGFNKFRHHDWIGAYKDAKAGIDHFKETLEIDSTLYDVYLGLGSYYYWRTAKSKFIRIIAFWMSDKRDLGLRQLRFTIDHGRYAVNEATYVLLASYFDAEQYQNAMDLVEDAVDRKDFANLTDLYFEGRLYIKFQRWPDVETVFLEILNRIKDYKFPSIGYQVECKYWIAKSKAEQGELKEALLLAREALMQSRKRNPDLEIEGHIDSFEDIRKDLEEFHENLNEKLLEMAN